MLILLLSGIRRLKAGDTPSISDTEAASSTSDEVIVKEAVHGAGELQEDDEKKGPPTVTVVSSSDASRDMLSRLLLSVIPSASSTWL